MGRVAGPCLDSAGLFIPQSRAGVMYSSCGTHTGLAGTEDAGRVGGGWMPEHPGVYGYFLLGFGSSLGFTRVCVAACDGRNGMAGEMDAAQRQ